MTVLEVIQRSTEFLARKGVDNPRLQVELLLAHLLQIPRLQLYLRFDQALPQTTLDSLRDLVRRRGARQPLQHLVGSVNFCGLDLRVTSDALIPRPETERLAEFAWSFLNQDFPASHNPSVQVLDYGTGTGCIALAIARHAPHARVLAVDSSDAALGLAQTNARSLGLADRVEFRNASRPSQLAHLPPSHLIVSNPPYIPTAEIDTLEPEVRDHDPRAALDGGPDGLDAYRFLAAESQPLLAPNGRLFLEIGDRQADDVQTILAHHKWIVEALHPDYNSKLRVIQARPEAEPHR